MLHENWIVYFALKMFNDFIHGNKCSCCIYKDPTVPQLSIKNPNRHKLDIQISNSASNKKEKQLKHVL